MSMFVNTRAIGNCRSLLTALGSLVRQLAGLLFLYFSATDTQDALVWGLTWFKRVCGVMVVLLGLVVSTHPMPDFQTGFPFFVVLFSLTHLLSLDGACAVAPLSRTIAACLTVYPLLSAALLSVIVERHFRFLIFSFFFVVGVPAHDRVN